MPSDSPALFLCPCLMSGWHELTQGKRQRLQSPEWTWDISSLGTLATPTATKPGSWSWTAAGRGHSGASGPPQARACPPSVHVPCRQPEGRHSERWDVPSCCSRREISTGVDG